MDTSVNPCEDFFQYACNTKKRGKKVPFSREDISVDLVDLISTAPKEYSFIKEFYDSCLSITKQFSTSQVIEYCLGDDDCQEEELQKFGQIYVEFLNKIKEIARNGAWPVLTENWESLEDNFNFDWMRFSERLLLNEYYLGAFQYVVKRNKPSSINKIDS